MEKLEKVR